MILYLGTFHISDRQQHGIQVIDNFIGMYVFGYNRNILGNIRKNNDRKDYKNDNHRSKAQKQFVPDFQIFKPFEHRDSSLMMVSW